VLVDGKRIVRTLAAVQVGDAVFNAIPTQWLKDDLDHLGVPENLRLVFPVIKGSSAVGLLVGMRRPGLGRLTSAALVVYFMLALGAHARIKDRPLRFVPAAGMLLWSIEALRAYPVD